MAGAIGGLLAIDAVANHHVEPVFEQPLDHLDRTRRVIGRVAVHHQIDIGLDVGEHAPHHEALTLVLLAEDFGAGGVGHRRGIVGRIVVEDEDRRARQRGAEIGDNLGDCHALVVARHEHGNAIGVETAALACFGR